MVCESDTCNCSLHLIWVHVFIQARPKERGFQEVLMDPCTLLMSCSQIMFEWEILHKRKWSVRIPRTTEWLVIYGCIHGNHIPCVRDLEMKLSSVQPLRNESRKERRALRPRGRKNVPSNFWFCCPWLRLVTVKTVFGPNRGVLPLEIDPWRKHVSPSQSGVRNRVTRAVLFSGTWVKWRRKTDLEFPWILF